MFIEYFKMTSSLVKSLNMYPYISKEVISRFKIMTYMEKLYCYGRAVLRFHLFHANYNKAFFTTRWGWLHGSHAPFNLVEDQSFRDIIYLEFYFNKILQCPRSPSSPLHRLKTIQSNQSGNVNLNFISHYILYFIIYRILLFLYLKYF